MKIVLDSSGQAAFCTSVDVHAGFGLPVVMQVCDFGALTFTHLLCKSYSLKGYFLAHMRPTWGMLHSPIRYTTNRYIYMSYVNDVHFINLCQHYFNTPKYTPNGI